ncbi:DUF6155 family protein [Paenibacillus planticolens]|uniref:Uncharacterized protein n=1 Tax=Paenibacillus planticolens TaxID=2654976 RepID=A0ABX1ZHN9_9BACL|nr:DUF6155 family protein [Paenibacillus planticolens]NOU99395.1 hypothetical protein [Paenibacillus planticolens]
MSKLTIPQLKKELKSYGADTLISIIVDNYKSSPDVKKYIHMLLDPESTENQLFDEAKKKILHQFYPERGEAKLKLAEAKKAITEFDRLCNNQVKTIDLMIYYVELGVELANEYGDMYESYYYSMESTYANALQKIQTIDDNGLYFRFRDRLLGIVNDTDGMGWGFHDQLCEIYYGFAADYEDEIE